MTLDGKLEYWTRESDQQLPLIKKVQYRTETVGLHGSRFVYTAVVSNIKVKRYQNQDPNSLPIDMVGDVSLTIGLREMKQKRHYHLISLFPPKIKTTIEESLDKEQHCRTIYGVDTLPEIGPFGFVGEDYPVTKAEIVRNGALLGLESCVRTISVTNESFPSVKRVEDLLEQLRVNYDFVASLFQPIEEFINEWYKMHCLANSAKISIDISQEVEK